MVLALQGRELVCTERTIRQSLASPLMELYVTCHGSTDGVPREPRASLPSRGSLTGGLD